MGLSASYYEFDRDLPPMRRIADAIVPLIPDALAVVPTFNAEEAMWSEPRSTLLVCDTRIRVTLAARPEPRRRPGARRRYGPRCEIIRYERYLTLYGWGDPLDAARRAIESLGGTNRPPPPPRDWPQPKQHYPVTPGMRWLALAVMWLSFVVPAAVVILVIVLGR